MSLYNTICVLLCTTYSTRLILIVVMKAATLKSKKFSFYGIGTMQITSAVCRAARPAKFVRARHAKIAKSVATHSIEYSIYEARQQKS